MYVCTPFRSTTAPLRAETICSPSKHWYIPVAPCSFAWLTFLPKRLRASAYRRHYLGKLAQWQLSMASSLDSSLSNMTQVLPRRLESSRQQSRHLKIGSRRAMSVGFLKTLIVQCTKAMVDSRLLSSSSCYGNLRQMQSYAH